MKASARASSTYEVQTQWSGTEAVETAREKVSNMEMHYEPR